MWEEAPHARFWKRLVRQRAESNMLDEEYLRQLRCRNDRALEDQKMFGHIWAEHGTNIYKLIAKAHGENWDNEDDEKTAPLLGKIGATVTQKGNDNLVAAREGGPRQGLNELQGIAEKGVRVLEERRNGEAPSKKGRGPEEGQE